MPIKLLPLPKEKVIIEPPKPPVLPELPDIEGEIGRLTTTIKSLYPDLQWTKSYGMPVGTDLDIALNKVVQFANEDPFTFASNLRTMGRTEDTETLLRVLVGGSVHSDTGIAFTPEEIDEFIDEVFPGEEPTLPSLPPKALTSQQMIEQKIGRKLSFGEVLGTKPIPELGNKTFSMALVYEFTGEKLAPPPKTDFMAGLITFGRGLLKLPKMLGASILQAFQGQEGASIVDKDWADRFIEDANEDFSKFVSEAAEKYKGQALIPTNPALTITDLAAFSQNLAYSLTSMGAGLGVGVPIALVPVPGFRVAAYVTGTAASGAVAYQMTTYQIMQLYLELKNKENIVATGRGISREEERQLKAEFQKNAMKYGLWEAVPEAISNLAFVSILTAPLTNVVGKSIAGKIITKLAGLYGEELLTEAITQKGQAAIEAEAGLREGTIGWVEAFKEVAPQTFLLTTVMAGAGQTVITSKNAITKTIVSLKNEIGEGHPLYNRLKTAVAGEVGAIELPFGEKPKVPVTPEVTKAEIGDVVIVRDAYGREMTRGKVTKIESRETLEMFQGEPVIKDYYQVEGKGLYSQDLVQKVAISKAEIGMPEAGYQPAMFEEVIDREVRPKGKGELVQISMEDQLKLQEARRQTEEAAPDVREAYEAQAEIEGLRVTHDLDPVATYRVEIPFTRKVKQPDGTWKLTAGKRKVGLDFFISIKEQSFPEYFTVKQAELLVPFPVGKWAKYTQKGLPTYNKVPKVDVLDELAAKWNMTPDEIGDRVMAIREEKARIKQLESQVRTQMTETPLRAVSELTAEEVAENWAMIGQPKLTLKQVDALCAVFAEYILNPNTATAFELTRQLRSEALSKRFENLKARTQELFIKEGISAEAAFKQAISETLSGKLPVIKTDYLEGITGEMRDAHFAKVYHIFSKLGAKYQGEMAATITALTNALDGKPIPSMKGTGSILFPKGGSAWDRLNYVFGDRPRVLKAIEKMAAEKKPLKDIAEGVFREVVEGGRAPIPIDPEMADYLRNLQDIPYGYKTLLEPGFETPNVSALRNPAELEYAKTKLELGIALSEDRITKDAYDIAVLEARDKAYPVPPITKLEAPIEDAFKVKPMFNFMERSLLNRVLKELAWSPIDIGNFLKATKATLDNSYLRQAKVLSSGHPVIAYQGHNASWRAMFHQKSAEAEWQQIIRDPEFQIYEEIRLATGADPLRVPSFAMVKGTAQWRAAEEYGFPMVERLIPRLTAKAPHIKPFERAFVTGTNKIVWGVWKKQLKFARRYSEKIASGQVKLKVGEAFDIIQEMTDHQKFLADAIQRASLGRASGLAPAFNALFFAARSKLGRFFFPRHLISANSRVRAEAWKDFILMNAIFGGIMLLGDWLRLWETEKDPRNAEFMSARIGNMRIDPWAGYRQFVVLYARLVTGTGISSVTGAEYEVNKLGALETFFRSSLAPLPGILLDFWTGRNFLGAAVEITDARQWVERIASFSLWDIWEAYEEDWRLGVIAVIPAIYGEGVQTYTGDWVENFTKLGLPKYLENTAYGITEPRYQTDDFWADTAKQFIDVDPATLTKAKGYPEYIRAIAEARIINEYLAMLPSERLVSLNADPAKGTTFAQYYRMWLDREKIVASGDEEKLKEFDQDERTRNAQLGNFSQRQFALLNEYWAITDKKKQTEFLKQHEAEIGTNLRRDWLRSHPKENAQLAVWGQAKILTKEAHTQFKAMIKELDIPDSAIPPLTLPPETSIDTHFKYEDMVGEGKHGSWEAQLLLKQDALKAKDAKVQSYADWKGLTLPDTPIASLEIKTKPEYRQIYDKIQALSDNTSPDYIADEKARAEAVKKLKTPEYIDSTRRIEAIEKGTDDNPISDALIANHVEYGRIQDKEGIGSSSAESMLYRVDNPEYDKFRTDEVIWGDNALKPIDQTRIPIWRIDVKYRKEDAEYDALPVEGDERANYLAENEDYRKDRRRREAYQKGLTDWVEDYVAYYELPVIGYRQERYLFKNPDFANALGLKISDRVPSEQYDILLEKEDKTPEDLLRMDAYKLYVPDQYIEDYVAYKAVEGTKGYEDDWWMMEHPDYYREVYLNKDIYPDHKRKDYRLVPTREVYAKYLEYQGTTEGKPRDDYRWNLWQSGFEAFEDWLLLTGKVTVHIKDKKRRATLTPTEKFKEEIGEREKSAEEILKEIEEGLARLKK